MAEKLAAAEKPGPQAAAKREGVVNLWRSTRTMQIWIEVQAQGFSARSIGDEVTLLVQHEGKELWRWSAPRAWFDEQLRVGGGIPVPGVMVPRETMTALLGDLDARRPALVTQASKLAAATQANIETEKAAQPDALSVAGAEVLP